MEKRSQPQTSPFDEAALYDALAGGRKRLEREGPLLRRLLAAAPRPTAVDTACGTGLHARFLAEAGAEVEAVDLSEGMVAFAAQRRPHPRVRYRAGDMCAPLGGPYGLAICLGNSLSLLPDADALHAAFRAVAEALAPGGRYLAQVLNYAAPAAREPRHRIERRAIDGGQVTTVKNLVPEGERTFLNIAHLVAADGRTELHSDTALLWNWDLAALQSAGKAAGLSLDETLGGFDESPYAADRSSDLITVFRRPA